MKLQYGVFLVGLVFAIGCGSPKVTTTGSDGEKVTTDMKGNVTVTDKTGKTTDFKTNSDGWEAKSTDGSEVKVDKGGVTGKTAEGGTYSMGASEVSEQELGLPFYPGSAKVDGRDMKVDNKGEKTFSAVRTTSDTIVKVVDFYKDKVAEAATTTSDQFGMVSGKLEDGRKASISAIPHDGKVEITITVSNSK